MGPDTGIDYRVAVTALLVGDGNAYNDTLVAQARSTGESSTDPGVTEAPSFWLGQCYPNPFNPSTAIRFTLAEAARARLSIYDVSGRLVRRLVDEQRGAGTHNEIWDGTDGTGRGAASGVYFYRLEAGPFTQTRKMVLLR